MLHRTFPLVPTVAVIFLAALSAFGSLAHADSVLWSTVLQQVFSPASSPRSGLVNLVWKLENPGISIQYAVAAFEVDDAGNKIRELISGSTVPVGTTVLFEFPAHVNTDISWYGTGSIYGTPYGTWSTGANDPRTAFCSDDNLFDANVPIGDYEYGYAEGGRSNLYAALAVAPPSENVEVVGDGASCTAVPGFPNKICTLSRPGTSNAIYTFAPTVAKFYGDVSFVFTDQNFIVNSTHYGGTARGCRDSGAIGSFTIPQQTISFSLSVTRPTGNPPATPTLKSDGACTVGTAQSISMQSTDLDGDALRYGVDWDANGTLDQWMPPSSYVSSGTAQTASRTYAVPGSKTVKVLAQDQNGLSSSWASISFNCAGSATTGLNEGSNDNSTTNGTGDLSLLPNLDLRVVPSLVRSGNTTRVNWSTSNVQSCTVTAPNGDLWTSLLSPLRGQVSQPITTETTYTLTCIDLEGETQTKHATVRILPTFQEL